MRELAASRGQSMSQVLADLTMHGLARLEVEVEFSRDPRSGMPVISIGRAVTDADIAAALEEE
ncbi:hypothetical protein [Microbacterium sp. NIBRBAC000506063]|uniref:hypothetical protein n=1 Tax=Microbacterium sp. NIBRBAC000506063 TaxID=2734618 RepID=UPI001BB6FA69|nr:hypothetical protein [Microbacterium sp. NIBRBAC000506063]QTV79033.1 hypothetical protein KAE78_07700 [Microbacterium sp. NIBRBAC000506063]